MLVHPSRNVLSSSTTRIRMVGFASGGMESASKAPREARVSDIPEVRGTRPCVTGSSLRAASSAPKGCRTRQREGAVLAPHAVARPLPRPVNVPTTSGARKRLETNDFVVVTDPAQSSRIMLLLQSIGAFGPARMGPGAPLQDSRGRDTFEVGSLFALSRPRVMRHIPGDRRNVACCSDFARPIR